MLYEKDKYTDKESRIFQKARMMINKIVKTSDQNQMMQIQHGLQLGHYLSLRFYIQIEIYFRHTLDTITRQHVDVSEDQEFKESKNRKSKSFCFNNQNTNLKLKEKQRSCKQRYSHKQTNKMSQLLGLIGTKVFVQWTIPYTSTKY